MKGFLKSSYKLHSIAKRGIEGLKKGVVAVKKQPPKLPIPLIDESLKKYLEYANVICDGNKDLSFTQTLDYVNEFYGEGVKIQEELERISESCDNWGTKYWLPQMYLEQRGCLPVLSNPIYTHKQESFKNVSEQLKFAAWKVFALQDYRESVANGHYPFFKDKEGNEVVECTYQLQAILNSYRDPGVDKDTLYFKGNDKKDFAHFIVMVNNKPYFIHTKFNGTVLTEGEIEYQLTQIVDMSKEELITGQEDVNLFDLMKMSRGSEYGASGGTALGRGDAAKFWGLMVKDKKNRDGLDLIRDASAVLCLDFIKDTPFRDTSANYEDHVCHRINHMVHGHGPDNFGLNRWYEATVQYIVADDGTNGVLLEHSVVDGSALKALVGHIQFVKRNEKSAVNVKLNPFQIKFEIKEEARWILESGMGQFDYLSNQFQVNVLKFDEFGKDLVKRYRVSPDGFVQLAFQLTHYKLFNCLVSSYESCSTRAFHMGRVDNVRAATREALSFVKAMTKFNKNEESKLKKGLLIKAAAKHGQIAEENRAGQGIDNHLGALYELATQNKDKMPKIFSDKVWGEMMRFPISTSQASFPAYLADGITSYGAVTEDGIGIFYDVQPNYLFFAISNYNNSTKTSEVNFKAALRESLMEMGNLLVLDDV
uniref:Carn_acyltransf domain-containing protein n=1 Tax=Rhabditophanes sp. KR3021 TaxID=114890 RepID=A0AC35TP34_9BILA